MEVWNRQQQHQQQRQQYHQARILRLSRQLRALDHLFPRMMVHEAVECAVEMGIGSGVENVLLAGTWIEGYGEEWRRNSVMDRRSYDGRSRTPRSS